MQIYADKCFKNPEYIVMAFDSHSFKDAVTTVEELSRNHYVLGYIRYEAKEIFLNKNITTSLPLLYFEAYKDFEQYSPEECPDADIEAAPDITFEQYEKALTSIKNEIAQGNTYEVNYTYDWTVKSSTAQLKLYNTLLKRQKTPYNAFIQNSYETIMSFSPELFFEKTGQNILTKPMKGTIGRGNNNEQDKKNIEFLKNDIKNRAENVMIVDLLRNDLGRIAQTGTVRVPKLFEIETHKTLHQMTSTITAELKAGTSLYNVLEAIFPCGSITGAPKISTMDIIDRVETGKRNIYCGAIGFLSPEKSVFSVPIRILQKPNTENFYKYRVGGAIVWDSDIKDEWEETVTKMSFLKTPAASALATITTAAGAARSQVGCSKACSTDFQIIETIRAQDAKLLFAKEHFDRMRSSAQHFGFIFPEELANITPEKDGMVRILLDKDGTFTVEYKELSTKTNFDSLRPDPHFPPEKIEISKLATDSTNEFLYHKTTRRDWYKEAFEKIKSGCVYDVIFFNEKGQLTEGARSNILLEIGGKIYTPALCCGLLNGVMRRRLLESGKCIERILTREDLERAEKIFCINSVRGIREVTL